MGKKYKRNKRRRTLRKVWSQNKPDEKRSVGRIAQSIINEFNEKENAFAKSLDALTSGELKPAPGKAMIQLWQRRAGSLDKWFPIRMSHELVRFFCGWRYYFVKTDSISGKVYKSQVFAGRPGTVAQILGPFRHTIKWTEQLGD
jgi:hypothetical protein